MTWNTFKSNINWYVDAIKFGIKFKSFTQNHRAWSDAVFGTPDQRNCIGPLKHMKLEIDEVIAKPFDKFEWADCVLLLTDAQRRAGFNWDIILDYAVMKLEINKNRKWNVPINGEPCVHAE